MITRGDIHNASSMMGLMHLATDLLKERDEALAKAEALLLAMASIHAEASDRQDTTSIKILDRIKNVANKAIAEAPRLLSERKSKGAEK